jgi:hypothetical protein
MRTASQVAIAVAVVSSAAAWIAVGCAPLPGDDCGSQHNCPLADGSAPDAASDAAAGDTATSAETGDGATCDGAAAPSDAPCVISETYGVFVSPVGSDGNVGTRAAPLLTIGHGMDLAKAAGKRVYVCGGSFGESLVVNPSRDGVNVYGGFDCGTWTYGAANRVTVDPSQPGYALKVEGLVKGAAFQDLEFDAPRASLANPGQSSIAVFVNGSQQVTFERVVMVAGNGTDGAAGASGQGHGDGGPGSGASNWYGTPPAYTELNGNDATSGSAGSQKVCACGDATSSAGGQGGAGPGDAGQIPGPGLPSYGGDAGTGASGHNGSACGAGGSPVMSGVDGPAAPASSPSSLPGTISASGWTPANGGPGADGQPGQGGGGGGDGPAGVGGGGGGACGGCGGAGGKAGGGGGSSIALLSYLSAVTLVGCSLTANNAGNGGAGGDGEAGQPASLIGGSQTGSGCQGGGGGSGAGGNGGQGGPGGLSLGIGYAGTAPTFDGNAVSPGQTLPPVLVGRAGAAGPKSLAGPAAATNVGQPQAGADGPAGLAGIAQPVLSF